MSHPLRLTRVCFQQAFHGFSLPMDGYACSLHGVPGFVVHRLSKRQPWRVSHASSGRRVGLVEGRYRHEAIAAAEAFVGTKAREFGMTGRERSFLQTSLFHFEQGQAQAEASHAA